MEDRALRNTAEAFEVGTQVGGTEFGMEPDGRSVGVEYVRQIVSPYELAANGDHRNARQDVR
jgi:hypothetical protein